MWNWIVQTVGQFAVKTTVAVAGAFVVMWIAKKILDTFRPMWVNLILKIIAPYTKAEEDKLLAIALIHWAEIKFKNLTGSERKVKVIEKLRFYLPVYTQPAAAELVQLAFDEVGLILQKTADTLKSNA